MHIALLLQKCILPPSFVSWQCLDALLVLRGNATREHTQTPLKRNRKSIFQPAAAQRTCLNHEAPSLSVLFSVCTNHHILADTLWLPRTVNKKPEGKVDTLRDFTGS